MGRFSQRWKRALSQELGVGSLDRVLHDKHELITKQTDLPDPIDGTITLKASTVYEFDGFVTVDYEIEPNGINVFRGRHGGVDGLVYTGGGTAIKSSGASVFMEDLYVSAPLGTVFDISGSGVEFMCNNVSFADALMMGNIASLGTISGFRVPAFKECNFEDFDAGFTFDGSPDKIFFAESPFREVDDAGVTILTFASTLDCELVDMTNNYIKNVQPDTKVIDVKSGGSPSDVFQYRGTTHDTTVTISNVLNGEAGVGKVGYRVVDSYPLADSTEIGEVTFEGSTGVGITSQNTYTPIAPTTTLQADSERFTKPSDGVLRYVGKKDVKVLISGNVTADAPANETFEVGIAKNGTVDRPSARAEGAGNTPVPVGFVGTKSLSTNDEISVEIKNIDSATDITIELFDISVTGI